MTNAIKPRAGGLFESDKDLVDAIGQGDKSAIECFFAKYSRLIYAQIHKRVKYQDVSDIYQEFFLYISRNNYRAICSWKRECSLTNWLCIILRNFIIGRIKKQQGNPGLEELDENMADPEGPDTDLPVEILGEEMKRTLEQAMVKLSDRDRDLITRRHSLGQSPQEIAESLGIQTNAYYQAQFRAEKRLANIVREHFPELFEYF